MNGKELSHNKTIETDQVKRTFTLIDSAVVSLNNLSESMSLLIRQSREDLSVSLENIREASENADQLMKVLAENPSLLLRGEAQRERTLR